MANPKDQVWRVGQLSEATGLTVRTLHHYDQIGLLAPSRRSTGGHRLYLSDDVSRLSTIVILRRAGLPLAEIKILLAQDSIDVAELIEQQASRLEAALIETVAFGRRLQEHPIDEIVSDPLEVRELTSWMPAMDISAQPIVFLVYRDVEEAHRRLIEMFGFGQGVISRKDDGTVGYAEIAVPMGTIRLHGLRPGLQAPDPGTDPSSMTVVEVADVIQHARRAEAAGAQIDRPVATLFGMREYLVFDHEHHLWCFQQPVQQGSQDPFAS